MSITRRAAPLSRRQVLSGLAAVPALPWLASNARAAAISPAALPVTAVAPTADQLLNVMEFEPLARAALPPAHFGYLATGVDDDRTVAINHDAFSHLEIRPRRFVDVTQIDTAIRVYGTPWASPLYLSAVSSMRAVHPEGELAVARAARRSGSSCTPPTTGASPRGSCVAPRPRAAPRSC